MGHHRPFLELNLKLENTLSGYTWFHVIQIICEKVIGLPESASEFTPGFWVQILVQIWVVAWNIKEHLKDLPKWALPGFTLILGHQHHVFPEQILRPFPALNVPISSLIWTYALGNMFKTQHLSCSGNFLCCNPKWLRWSSDKPGAHVLSDRTLRHNNPHCHINTSIASTVSQQSQYHQCQRGMPCRVLASGVPRAPTVSKSPVRVPWHIPCQNSDSAYTQSAFLPSELPSRLVWDPPVEASLCSFLGDNSPCRLPDLCKKWWAPWEIVFSASPSPVTDP